MTRRRLIGWMLFYAGIALAILVTYLFLQERFARDYPREGHNPSPVQVFCQYEQAPAGAADG